MFFLAQVSFQKHDEIALTSFGQFLYVFES